MRASAEVPRVALLLESSRAAGRDLLRGIADYAHDNGPWSFYWEPVGLEAAWPRLKSLDLHGIIVRDVGRLSEVLRFGIPAVVVGHSRTEVPDLVNVGTDSAEIGRIAADHLLGCGFKRFAFCGLTSSPGEQTSWSQQREVAFRDCVGHAGYRSQSHSVGRSARQSWKQQRRILVEWLVSLDRPCGLMACNDDMAKEVLEACKMAGLAVPDDVAIIGADNDELVCGLSNPPLSSVAIHFERAGYQAAEALDRLMLGVPLESRRIMARAAYVVPRRSTDVFAVDDAGLAKALRFIRDNAATPVSVHDVAQAAGLSRRLLEQRWRAEFNRSVLDEIRRARTDQIGRLLAETDLPVAEIGARLGFDGPEHVARYFQAVKKSTPLAYRKAHRFRTAFWP